MKKRGQVTIFIIVAILIIGAVTLFFAFRGGIGKGRLPTFEVTVQNQVNDCLFESTLDSIYFNSLQGGYFNAPEDSMEVSFLSVPVYFDKGVSKIPSKEILEEELSKTIEEGIFFCLDFGNFEDQGYQVVTPRDPEVNVNLLEGQVDVELNYLIALRKGDSVTQFESFETQVDFDYLRKYELVNEFIELQKTDPEYVFLTQLEILGEREGFNAKLVAIQGTGDYFYNFIYPAETNKDQTYMYSFTIKY